MYPPPLPPSKKKKKLVFNLQRQIQVPYHIWRRLQHSSSLYVKGSLRSAITSIKTETANGLVMNQINISSYIQTILRKFAVTVVRLQLTFQHLKSF